MPYNEQHYRNTGFDVTQERRSTVTMETGWHNVTHILYSVKSMLLYQEEYGLIQ